MEEESKPNFHSESEDEVAVSMVDILEEEEKLQESANAVLGGSDDRNCTYPMGYVDRQALYSCKTCAAESHELAGVCLACSLECHEGHELIELYTKRNFRCDCGNRKFRNFSCKLYSSKSESNPDNQYNHNYRGVYCSCLRPYPDPDQSTEDEMIQCIICEDWFHKAHVNDCTIEDEFDEMICGSCMDKCGFLWSYARLCKATYDKTSHSSVKTNSEADVDAGDERISAAALYNEPSNSQSSSHEMLNRGSAESSETSLSSPSNVVPTTSHSTAVLCRLKELDREDSVVLKGAIFWQEEWRKQLCQCPKCMEMYTVLGVLFLLNENDTIAAYEDRGKSKAAKTSYQQGMEALSKLDRVQQVDLIQEYNDLKSNLTEYLKKFAENKKVVRQEDVDEFFTQFAAKKRQKVEESPQLPYYCK